MSSTEAIAEKFSVSVEQAKALDFMENTALRASAGSGKTRVLTKRFVRILLEETDADLDDIIAITFTRKAATEMKDRIRRELAVWLKKPQYEDDIRLAGFKLRMSEARIDTIHGFLGKLIRRYFQVMSIDPGFTILEEVDAKVLMMRFADASIRAIHDDASQEGRLYSFMKAYGANLAGPLLRDAVISLYQAMRTAGDTVENLKNRYAEYQAQVAAADPGKPSAQIESQSAQNGLSSAMAESSLNEGTIALEQIGLDLLEQLDNRFKEYKDRENVLDFSDLELLACDLLEKPESCLSIRDSFRHLMMDEFQDVNPLQMRIVNLLARDGNGDIPPGRLFIVGDGKQSIYGFRGADHQVFGNASVTIANQGSTLQLLQCYRCTEPIIQTVNLVFNQLMSPYEPLHLPYDKPGQPVELITWNANDRKIRKPSKRWASYKELIPDGHPEDTDAALRAPYREAVETSRLTLQGDVIAGRMAALNAEGVPFRNMAILVPSRTSLAAIENGLYSRSIPYCVLGGLGFWSRTEVADILHLYRLIFQPQDRASFYAVLRSPLFAFSDDLLLKCRHVDREAADEPLRPEILLERLAEALSDEAPDDLAERSNSGHDKENSGSDKENFDHDNAMAVSDKEHFTDAMRSARAAGIFKCLLPLDGLLDPSELFREVLDATGYSDILLLLPNGEKKIRNLEKLTQMVNDFSRKHGYTARDLPAYLSALEESGGMDSEAFLDNEDSEAVKILTIHASKGLEFPVVFLPSMDRAVDTVGARFKPLLVMHPVNGISAIGVDEDQNTSPAMNPAYQEVFITRLRRELEESRRVFYVAATRAKSLLVMIGEHQSAKGEELEAQNSFMKQLSWALKGSELPDSLVLLDAGEYLSHSPTQPDLETSQPHSPIQADLETSPSDTTITSVLSKTDGLNPEENVDGDGAGSIDYFASDASDKAGKTEHAKAAEVVEYPYEPESPSMPIQRPSMPVQRSPMPVHRPSGLVSVSQWMSWRDCPRQYWLSRIIRMPGQPEIQAAQDTLPETFQDSLQELSQDSTHGAFKDSFQEAIEDSSQDSIQELSQDSTQELSQDSSSKLADPDLTLDAARLGTWIHTQLQEIPLDRSGPFPVLGRCDLSKTRIPRWLENQKQHALILLEGYNLIIGNADRNPAVSETSPARTDRIPAASAIRPATSAISTPTSERLVHSWSEFEFRIKASDSLELIGVIDRLDIVETPDGFRAVISDYKSNHIQDDPSMLEKAAYYAIQLQVYAWAISRMPIWQGKPVEVIRGELYFLDAGQSVTVDVGCVEREKAVDSLIQALPDLLGLLSKEGYPMKEGDACTWCQHKKICDMLRTLKT